MNEHVHTEQHRAHVGERHVMCNDHRNRIPYRRYVEEFSHLRLPVFVQGNGPELTPRDDIRIRDTAPDILRTTDGVELMERIWAPRAANKKPIFNFRSEKRNFGESTRCFIPASHFFEFTAPTDPKQKRKNKWRFTLAGADWFCIAGIIGADAIGRNRERMFLHIMTGRLSCCRAKTGARGPISPGLEPNSSAPFQGVRSRRNYGTNSPDATRG
jgi:hypothetical protein